MVTIQTHVTSLLDLYNTIIANKGLGGDCVNPGTTINNIHNLIEDGTCNTGTKLVNFQSGDPVLGVLGNYGGSSAGITLISQTIQTIPLLPGSPALNAGLDATCEVTDQRGQTRFGTCDIGAFESQGFSLNLTGGNSQSTQTNTDFTAPLEVTITTNAAIEPVGAGGIIIFNAPSSGASLNPVSYTVTTNISGMASTSVTAKQSAR